MQNVRSKRGQVTFGMFGSVMHAGSSESWNATQTASGHVFGSQLKIVQ